MVETEKEIKIKQTLNEVLSLTWEDKKTQDTLDKVIDVISTIEMKQYVTQRWNASRSPRELDYFIQSILQSNLGEL